MLWGAMSCPTAMQLVGEPHDILLRSTVAPFQGSRCVGNSCHFLPFHRSISAPGPGARAPKVSPPAMQLEALKQTTDDKPARAAPTAARSGTHKTAAATAVRARRILGPVRKVTRPPLHRSPQAPPRLNSGGL